MSVGSATYELKLDGLNDVINGINQVQKAAQAASRSASTAFRNIGKTMQATSGYAGQSGKAFSGLTTQLQATNQAARQTNAALGTVGKAASSAGQQASSAGGGFASFRNALGSVNESVNRFGTSVREMGFDLTRVGYNLTAGLTVPITAAAGTILKFGSDFESAFAGVVKTVGEVGETAADLEPLRQGIRDLALELPQSAVEIAGVAEAAGQLGIQKENILEFTRVMVDLGVATDLTSQQAAVSLSRFANITGLSADQFDNLGSSLVHLGNNFAATESEIVQLALRLAGAGEVIGLTEADILGFATALRALGLPAESAGTALSRTFLEINSAVKAGSEELEVFARVAGLTATEFTRMFEENPREAVLLFIEGLNELRLQGADLVPILESVSLQNLRVRDTLTRAATGGELMRSALDQASIGFVNNNALTEEAARRYETVASQFQILKNKGIDIAIEAFDALRPVILDVIDTASGFLDTVREWVEAFAEMDSSTQRLILSVAGMAAAIGPITVVIGGVVTAVGALIAIFGSMGVVVGSLAVSLGGLAAAYLLVKTNQEFFSTRTPLIVSVIESFEDSVVRLTESFREFGESLGVIDEASAKSDELNQKNTELGDVLRRTGDVAVAFGLAYIGIIEAEIRATTLLLDTLLLVAEALDPTNLSIQENFGGALQAAYQGQFEVPVTVTFDTADIREKAGRVQESFTALTEGTAETFKNAWDVAINGVTYKAGEIEKLGPSIADALSPEGVGFDRFFDAFDELVLRGSNSFKEVQDASVEWAKEIGLGTGQYITQMRKATNETELFQALWGAIVTGAVDASDVIKRASGEFIENAGSVASAMKFIEDNTYGATVQTEALGQALNDLNLQRVWDGIGAGAGAYGILRDNIQGSRDAISLWESDASTAEEAINALTGIIDEQGYATEEQAEKLELLRWYYDRLTNGIKTDMIPAFVDNVASQAEWLKIQEEIKEQFTGPDGNIANQEAYTRAMEEAEKKFIEAQDPMARFTGDLQKVADSFSDTVGLIREMLKELGLIPDDSLDGIGGNASKAAGNVAGLGDEIVEVGEAASKEPVIKVHTEESEQRVNRFTQATEDVPDLVSTTVAAETEDAETGIGEVGRRAEDLPESVTTTINADVTEAETGIGGLLTRAGTWADSTFTAPFDADAATANSEIEGLISRAGSWATGDYTATLSADPTDANTDLDNLIGRAGNWALASYQSSITADASDAITDFNTVETRGYLLNGKVFSITVDADIAPAMNKLTILGQNTPSSPAEVGPLAKEPRIEVAGDITPALDALQFLADAAAQYSDEAIEHLKGFIDVLNGAVDLISGSIDLGLKLNETGSFDVDTSFIGPIVSFTEQIIVEIEAVATSWEEEVVTRIQTFVDLASSGVDLISSAVDALTGLDEFDVDLNRALKAASQIKFIIEHVILSLGDSMAIIESGEGIDHPSVRGRGFVAMADEYAQHALSGVELIGSAITNLSGLGDFSVNLDAALAAATQIKFLVEHIVLALGDSAAIIESGEGVDHPSVRGEGFVGMAGTYAENAQKAVALIGDALSFISALNEFEGTFNLAGALAAASNLKFLIEHIVLSIGDSAAAIAYDSGHPSYRGEGFVELAGEFAEQAEAAVSLVGDALDVLTSITDFDGTYDLDGVIAFVDDIALVAEAAAIAIGDAALRLQEIRGEGFLEAAQNFAEKVAPAFDLLSGIIDFLQSLTELLESIGDEADILASVAFNNLELRPFIESLVWTAEILAEEMRRASVGWEEVETVGMENLATAVSNAASALTDVIDLIDALDEGIVVPDLRGIGRLLSEQARIVAEEFKIAAEGWDTEVDESAQQLATAVGDAIGAISDVFDFLQNFRPEYDDNGKQIAIITSLDGLRGIARQLAAQARIIAEEFAEAAKEWDVELNDSISAFAEAVDNALSAINGILDFIQKIEDIASGKGEGKYGGSGFDQGPFSKNKGPSNFALNANLQAIGEAIGEIVDAFVEAIDKHNGKMEEARGKLENFTSAFEAITTGFITTVLGAYTDFSDVYIGIHENMNDTVLANWEAGAEQMVEVGENFIDGMIRGLENREGALYDKVTEIVNNAIDAANDAAQNASPSRRMIEVGENFGLGFAVGVGNTEQNTVDVTAALVQSAITQAAIMVQAWEDFNAALNAQGEGTNARFFGRLEALSEFADMFGNVVSNFTGIITDFTEAIETIEDPSFFGRVTAAAEKMSQAVIAAAAIMVQQWEDFNDALNNQGEGTNARFFGRLEALSEFSDMLSNIASNLASAVESLTASFEALGVTMEEGVGILTGPSGGGAFIDALNGGGRNSSGRPGEAPFLDALSTFFGGNSGSGSSGPKPPSLELQAASGNPAAIAELGPTPIKKKKKPKDPPQENQFALWALSKDQTELRTMSYAQYRSSKTGDIFKWASKIFKNQDPQFNALWADPLDAPMFRWMTRYALETGNGPNQLPMSFEGYLNEEVNPSGYATAASGGYTLGDGAVMLHKDELVLNPSAAALDPLGDAIVKSVYSSLSASGSTPLDRLANLMHEASVQNSQSAGTINGAMSAELAGQQGSGQTNVTIVAPDTRPSTIENAVTLASQKLARRMAGRLS